MENINNNSRSQKLIKIFIDGFILGMILQLAIGPVCLYIFKKSVERGFFYSELIVIGVFIIDAFYIFWAIFGISTFLKYNQTKIIMKILGFIILLFFGINIIISEIAKINFIPSLSILKKNYIDNPFVNGLLLTLANPLTIIFWIGIFSGKIVENKYSKKEIVIYGLGALIPTVLFLTAIIIIGIIIKIFLSDFMISLLNILIGLIIIFFSIKILFKRIKIVN